MLGINGNLYACSYVLSADDHVNREEVNMIAGVLNFATVQVKDKMSKEVFSLNVNDKFDLQV
jgi:CBS domain containing-hemolysin-like protein